MNRVNKYRLNKKLSSLAYNDRIDELEVMINRLPPVQILFKHEFEKGVYKRGMLAPKGAILTSKIHKTEHEFEVSLGSIAIFMNGHKQIIKAPFKGITKAGTRRVGIVLEDVIWTTKHEFQQITGEENSWSDEDKQTLIQYIQDEVIKKHENKLLAN